MCVTFCVFNNNRVFLYFLDDTETVQVTQLRTLATLTRMC